MHKTHPQSDRALEGLVAHRARKLLRAVHAAHVGGQRKLIGRHPAAQVACHRHLIVAFLMLAQVLLVGQQGAARAALHLRLPDAAVHATRVLNHHRFGLERDAAHVADVRRNVNRPHVAQQYVLGVESGERNRTV